MTQNFVKYMQAGTMSVSNLLLRHYHEVGLTEEELVLILQLLSYHQEGDDFPSIDAVATIMGKPSSRVYELMHQLLQKKLLRVDEAPAADGRSQQRYDMAPLYAKLGTLLTHKEQAVNKATHAQTKEDLFAMIEKEFGRTLSPIEGEMIDGWLTNDHYSPAMVELALKEAVLSQVYNLKYIDRILIAWEKRNLTTPAAVERDRAERRAHQVASQPAKKQGKHAKPAIPMYHWTDQK